MNNMIKTLLVVIIVVGTCCFIGCQTTKQTTIPLTPLTSAKHVGIWSGMKWFMDNNMSKWQKKDELHTFKIPSEGGEAHFECENYIQVWISSCIDVIHKKNLISTPGNSVSTVDLKILADGNKVLISVAPNPKQKKRKWQLELTAGNVFHTITLIQ